MALKMAMAGVTEKDRRDKIPTLDRMINTGSQCCHQRTTNKHLASSTRSWQEAPGWGESVRVPGEQHQEDKVPPQQNRKKWTGELHRQLGGAAKVARGKKVKMLVSETSTRAGSSGSLAEQPI